MEKPPFYVSSREVPNFKVLQNILRSDYMINGQLNFNVLTETPSFQWALSGSKDTSPSTGGQLSVCALYCTIPGHFFSISHCGNLYFFHVALFSYYTLFMLHFIDAAPFPCHTFQYINFFMLHYLHVALFPCCTLFILHNFNFVFCLCCTLFMYCTISCCTFTCCKVFVLHASPVAFFAWCTLFMLHYFQRCNHDFHKYLIWSALQQKLTKSLTRDDGMFVGMFVRISYSWKLWIFDRYLFERTL